MKKVAVLGSTGSIGTQTLDVVRANDDLEVVGLAAGSNVEMLEKQIREFHPKLVAVWKEEAARDLETRVRDLDVKIVSQMGKTHGAMLSAILLGEKSGLDPEMKKLYQKNGLGHLLAISGLHMSLIGMSVYQLLRRMGNSFLFSGIAGGGILFCYLVMTGPQGIW